jgi:hypothetical protein
MKKSSLYRATTLCALALCLSLICAYQAPAQTAVDFNLFVCQSCSTPPAAPTIITNTGAFNVGDGGNNPTVGPLLIIVGTYNGAPAPKVSFGATLFSPGGAPIYGWNGSSAATLFNSGDGMTSAYTAVGIAPQGGGSSEQFGNWNSSPEGLTGNGIPAATSFNLYVYELTGVKLPAMGTVTLNLEGATTGSFVIGYACEVTGSPCPDGKQGATPFTTAGIVGPGGGSPPPPVPEPASMLLMGSGLVAVGGMLRRRKKAI